MDLKGAEIRNIKDLCKEMRYSSSNKEKPLKINIPYYQRPYKWDEEHIKTLIKDFYTNKEKFNKNKSDKQDAGYFVGSVVLVQRKDRKDGEQCYVCDVIDGQQRLTTIFLLNYLKLLLLRAYIEEYITLRRCNRLETRLKEFKECYTLFDTDTYNCGNINKLYAEICGKLDLLDTMERESQDGEYDEILSLYQKRVGLPEGEKDLTDMNQYKETYLDKMKVMMSNVKIALQYSRESYNDKLKEALSRVFVQVSHVKSPDLNVIEGKKDEIIDQYITAMRYEFEELKGYAFKEGNAPLENASSMIDAIDDMVENIKYCVIMTGNTNDAYTLFEVLNDRALAIDDLDLIKNLFYEQYCDSAISSKVEDAVIDKNIEELDKIWGDEIFTEKSSINKLISCFGAIYLTADTEISVTENSRYREVIKKEYFEKRYSDKEYSYKNVFNDITIYYMIKKIIEIYDLSNPRKSEAVIDAENSNKSITYITFHLLNAVKCKMVMPALTNIILKKYIDNYADGGEEKIDIDDFEKYIKSLENLNQTEYDKAEFEDIHKCAFKIWQAAVLAGEYNIPRDIAKKIIENVSVSGYNVSNTDAIFANAQEDLIKRFSRWTSDWKHSSSSDKDLRVKVLFMNLLRTKKEGQKLKFTVGHYTFSTNNLQLDHLDPKEINEFCRENYFQPEDEHQPREDWVNGLGNFMLLDANNNSSKNNNPLYMALDHYDGLTSPEHWLISEIKELLNDEKYSKSVSVVGKKDFRVPIERFFTTRKERLRRYFLAVLTRKYGESEIQIPQEVPSSK